MRSLIAVTIVAMFSSNATAYSGLDFQRDCHTTLTRKGQLSDPTVAISIGNCVGYLEGVLDAVHGQPTGICTPSAIKNEQLIRIVLKHLNDNPAKLHDRASSQILVALRDVFPCR